MVRCRAGGYVMVMESLFLSSFVWIGTTFAGQVMEHQVTEVMLDFKFVHVCTDAGVQPWSELQG